MITDRLDFGSHLNLCLTQKWFCQMIHWPPAPNVLEWVNFNVDFEKHAAGRRKHLICVECARLLPTANFQAQIRKANPKRFCIQCRIMKMGCKGGSFLRVGGESMFGCIGCWEAKPINEESAKKSSLCKACQKSIFRHGRVEPNPEHSYGAQERRQNLVEADLALARAQ